MYKPLIKLHKLTTFSSFFYGVISLLLFYNCSHKKNTNNYIIDKNGIYYKLLGIGDGTRTPIKDNILLLTVEIKTQSDSLFFNSTHSSQNGLIVSLNNQIMQKKFNDYFFKFVEGDSASFLINPTLFFRAFFDTISPHFCKSDTIIKFNFKISKILVDAELQALQLKNAEDNELQELKMIDNYLKIKFPKIEANNYGIYELQKNKKKAKKPELGNKITISYQGFFLDGKPLDARPQQIEYIYGTPDQFIKGLNIVIGTLNLGEIIKIIVPSRLAFGEMGSSNQNVQPYTPLIYNLTLIDIK